MITQENIPYTADEIKAIVKTNEELRKKYNGALERARDLMTNQNPPAFDKHLIEMVFPELAEIEDERIRKGIMSCCIDHGSKYKYLGVSMEEMCAWLEKQGEKKSVDEVLKIRQELYQSGYNDGYKHGQEDIAMSLEKKSIEALEHFVRSIGESGYASPYDNRTKLVYTLLERLKQIVK